MKIILLGSGGYRPNDRRHTACVMLPDVGLVLDAGTAFYRISPYLQENDLHVLLSHAHLDHVIGLTYLFDLVAKHPDLRVFVHGEAEKLDIIERHLWYPGLFPARPPCELVPLSTKSMASLPGTPRWFALDHPGGSIGFRLDFPVGSLAYVTDTTAALTARYVREIEGVDVLIHECYFGDDQDELARKTGHSCLTAVAEVARLARVGRLVLVHMNPYDESDASIDLVGARKIFPATSLGHDYCAIDLSQSNSSEDLQ